ncbi:flagellar motor protein MotB [Neptunomonas japonica]|uniref:Chemotaxis protein MotB n=1 Tax=Neptunomonas japonica JAMM 1380 TaxID=1441457 RepID=A0A7R6PUP1_9GAMM|nr:flagellar motor protein MotB [Neptunomonas japonica]BBB30815.1 chemotaxis protein MotB [Neptunomonas japonica JAMM 1380]
MSARRAIIDEAEPSWMVTYADLMTLLLVFFVLLFSISTVKKEQFASTIRSFQLAIGDTGGSLIPLPEELRAPAIEIPDSLEQNNADQITPPIVVVQEVEQEEIRLPEMPEAEEEEDLSYMSNSLRDVFASMGVTDAVDVGEPRDGKIRIRVKGSVLFKSGDAEFNRQMMPILDGLLEKLEKNPEFKMGIQGHTDNIPIETAKFPSNWELSAIRATTVLRYLVRGGIDPERVTATGYGDALPIAPNETVEQRAANRRIEFVLEKVLEP